MPKTNDRPVAFLVGGLLLLAIILFPLLSFHVFVLPTGSMEDTLLIGDRLLVQLFPKGAVSRGDVIALHFPIDRRSTFVKRVMGLPGDRLRMSAKHLFRNGSLLSEPYAVHRFEAVDEYRDNFPGNTPQPFSFNAAAAEAAAEMFRSHVSNGEVVVPPGKLFVLGDNRDNSLDSRYWGFLDDSDVVGKVILILYSVDSGPKPSARPGRFFRKLP